MLLSEWTDYTGIKPTSPTTEKKAVSVVIDVCNSARAELWHLDDYKVSSACGVVIWLVPSGNIDSSTPEIKQFADLSVGDKFRWVAGVTTFVKTGKNACCVYGNSDVYCYPSDWETTIPQ